VDWVNQAFSQVLPEQENIETGAVCYAPSDSFHDHGGEPAVQIHPQYRLDQGEEAAQVLTLIRETQAASPDDTIAILVQARQHLTAIARELRLANIHFQAIEIENLSRRPVIQDLLAITRALCHPADRVAWLALLRAPWCGLSLADLHQLVGEGARSTVWQLLQDEQRLAGLSAAGRTRLARITPVLARQLAQRRRLSLCKWVEGTWLALGGPACLASERDLADVDVYLDLLDTLGQRGGLIDLEELYQRVEQLYAVPEPQQGNAVQLMTIHKAKGLEFDTVIVPGLGRKRPGGETQLLMWMERPSEREEGDLLLAPIAAAGESADPTYQYLKRVDQAKAHHEAGRLLYVAATRAKKHLHLLGHTTCDDKDGEVVIKAPDGKSLLSQLWPVVESRYLTERERRAPIDETALAPDPEGRRALRRLVTDWSLPSLPPPCPVHVAPLDIRDEKNTIDYLWASPTARHVGTLVHRFLCQMTDENLGDWNSERIDGSAAFIRDQLLQLGVPDAELQHGVTRVTQALHNVLDDERGRWILSPQVAAAENEYPLTGVIDDAIVHLVIDRTFIDERGVRWIIDYKTGVHEGADPEGFLDNERERYREQLERYARLVRHLGPEPIRLGLYFPLMRGWREWAADVGPAA
jgi:ATP-dependent exoDNAse (exonuclease V) beta subunit